MFLNGCSKKVSYQNNQETIDEVIQDLDRYQERSFGTNSNGELQIKSVNMKHQGWYKCEASNSLGKVDAIMYLQVKSKKITVDLTKTKPKSKSKYI